MQLSICVRCVCVCTVELRERRGGAMGHHLYALDFDGVLCDSCGESSISALKVTYPSLAHTTYTFNLKTVRLS